ncbi:unnamed protein product [Protopolystoma xenopodis]|uniref:Uncharacterized protein n=1 Tax=Protopolystoma xenopodis TaxID=117903 RepID=A0A3S5AQD5_9PLAT|nr:unnamed protein product [Protopolystoma xenopodis]
MWHINSSASTNGHHLLLEAELASEEIISASIALTTDLEDLSRSEKRDSGISCTTNSGHSSSGFCSKAETPCPISG